MSKWKSLAAAVVATSSLLATGSASAACVHFQETKSGYAYLVNSCTIDMNAAYAVTSDGDWTPGTSPLKRISVAAEERKLLWTNSDRPFGGNYKIKVFSCVAPTNLIYQLGGRPTCQFSFADAG